MKQPNTKKRILNTALELFSQHGYAGTSIRQISGAIGIRESAIYNHYKSKEEIFLAILADFKSKTVGKEILSDDLLDDLSNPKSFLDHFTKRLVDHWSTPRERKFIRLLLMEQFTKIGSKELSVSDYLVELRSICKMIFGEMIKVGILKSKNTDTLAEEFLAPLFFLRTEKMSGDQTDNMDELYKRADQHVKFFWEAVSS